MGLRVGSRGVCVASVASKSFGEVQAEVASAALAAEAQVLVTDEASK